MNTLNIEHAFYAPQWSASDFWSQVEIGVARKEVSLLLSGKDYSPEEIEDYILMRILMYAPPAGSA